MDLDDNFIVLGKRLYCFSESDFLNNPIDFIKMFRVVQVNDCDIHPKMLQLISDNLHKIVALRKNPEANKIFLDILCGENAEKNLRRMSDAGVLAVFIPAFARITAQMQFDMYHVYTTVITSYSIHYTKLYDNYQSVFVKAVCTLLNQFACEPHRCQLLL